MAPERKKILFEQSSAKQKDFSEAAAAKFYFRYFGLFFGEKSHKD